MQKRRKTRKPRMRRVASAKWIAKLETLVEACADSLSMHLDKLPPETVASIMGIASAEITSYRALIPQGDDGDDQASAADAPGR